MTAHEAEVTQPTSSDFWVHESDGLYEPHVAPLNGLVDELAIERAPAAIPYVAPHHGGAGARILSVLADPGPKALGTGMLSVLNSDPTAAAQLELMRQHGIELGDLTPWNAYPWQHPTGRPEPAEIRGAVHALHRVLELLPDAQVVLLQGGAAHQAWDELQVTHPEHTARRLSVLRTFHPSRRGALARTREETERRARHRDRTWATAAWLIGRGEQPE